MQDVWRSPWLACHGECQMSMGSSPQTYLCGLTELAVVAEHDDRPLSVGQGLHEVPQRLGLPAVVSVQDRGLGKCVRDDLAPLEGAPPQGAVLVDEDATEVAVQELATLHAVPGEVELRERHRHQVLGGVSVTGEQVGGAQQSDPLRSHVCREVGVAIGRRRTHSLECQLHVRHHPFRASDLKTRDRSDGLHPARIWLGGSRIGRAPHGELALPMGRLPWEVPNILHPLVNLQRWPTSCSPCC